MKMRKDEMKRAAAGIAASLLFCGSALAADYVEPSGIQSVMLGDTFVQVCEKIGGPQQVVSKSLDDQGKEKVVWLYEAIEPPNLRGAGPGYALPAEQKYQIERALNPPYLVIFTDGKVSSIKRQDRL